MIAQPFPTHQIEDLLRQHNVVPRSWEAAVAEFGLPEGVSEVWVSYLSTLLGSDESVRDALDRTVPLGNMADHHRGRVVMLLDPTRAANWGHPCWIATYDISADRVQVAKSWFPPMETDACRLVTFEVFPISSVVVPT